MIQVSQKDNESFESLYRRFNKKYRESNLGPLVKSQKFRSRRPNKRLKKRSALVRRKIQDTKEYLRKIGKLEEVQDYRGRLKIKVKIKS